MTETRPRSAGNCERKSFGSFSGFISGLTATVTGSGFFSKEEGEVDCFSSLHELSSKEAVKAATVMDAKGFISALLSDRMALCARYFSIS